MEFNKLEKGIVRTDGSNPYAGDKMRRTQFESEAEKLAYDADNLIVLAQKISKEKGIAVSPESLISRDDDDVAALRKTIAIRLKTAPAAKTPPERLESKLSPGNREFLQKPIFRENHQRSIDVIKARNLGEGAPDYDQSLAFLAELHEAGEIDLDKVRALDAKGYGFELVVSPKELSAQEIQTLMERKNESGTQIKDFYCWDPSNSIFHRASTSESAGVRRFRVDLIAAGADNKIPYLPSEQNNSSSDHYNNGTNYDTSRRSLAAEKMSHPAPSAFFTLATGNLEQGTAIDLQGICILDMGERGKSPLVPVGRTGEGKVFLNRDYSVDQDGFLRVRPSAGGIYVPKET